MCLNDSDAKCCVDTEIDYGARATSNQNLNSYCMRRFFVPSFLLLPFECFLLFCFSVRFTGNKWQTRDLHETTINFPVMKCSIHSSQYHQPTLEWWRVLPTEHTRCLVLNGKEEEKNQNKNKKQIHSQKFLDVCTLMHEILQS